MRNSRTYEGKTGVTYFKELCMDTTRSRRELGQFCASIREGERASYRMYEVVIDAVEPERIARWWGEVFSVPVCLHWDLYGDVDDLFGRGATVLAVSRRSLTLTPQRKAAWLLNPRLGGQPLANR